MDKISSTEVFKWLVQKKDIITYGMVGLFIGGFALVQVMPKFYKPSQNPLILVEKAFASLKQEKCEKSSLQNFQKLLQKHSSLLPVYEGQMTQALLANGKISEVNNNAKGLDRLQAEVPAYSSFAKTSILIEEKKYEDALAKAYDLQKEICFEDNKALYVNNLLRIGILEKTLNHPKEELAIWTQMEDLISKLDQKQKTAISSFMDGSFSMEEYITYRKKCLEIKA